MRQTLSTRCFSAARARVWCFLSAAAVALCGCAPGPDVPRAVSFGAQPLAGQITAARPEGCAGEVPDGWFAALCPTQAPPDRIAELQRALAARGLYHGAATGRLDTATQAAIAAYQTPRGLPSHVLSVRAAQELGLIPWLD